ncbi:S8 family serine peptidase [Aliifodinibius halophilus]|uniref:S8 family serine peptidase n=1 Tax=Fodinibius halophilus TaxID=1736908 RepID=A0A6M1TC53_9BACT|nr:S8 family serine peptidase [Fodinibius halophilus]
MKRSPIFLVIFALLYGCSTTEPTTTKTQPAQPKVDFSTLEKPPQNWHHLDESQTQFRGISSKQAYQSILKKKKPQKEVVVAVIDGGVDTNHEDLKDNIWVNTDEIPNNQKDDDQNGYVDDIHGWNFVGGPDGKNVDDDTFELTRIYRRLNKQFKNIDTTSLSGDQNQQYNYYQEIRSDYEAEVKKLYRQYSNITSLEQNKKRANDILVAHFGSLDYTHKQVEELQPSNRQLNFAKNVMSYVFEHDIDSTLIADQKKQIYEFAKYGYNPDFNPRHIVGDDYEDKTEQYYGNNDVAGPDPSHGTHVGGIIAAVRDNETGVNGVAANTKIMGVRAVPNGDERDKDVANAIRYAVDNGADIINMSFGKSYSPYKEVVDEAVKYADKNGVLMVHGAGNESQNIDQKPKYPTDVYGSSISGDSAATHWLSVGATSWKPNENFIANFSNYGDQKVDIFAPGVAIYSTMPDNKYKRQDGTSMASPVVAGSAALIMAYYPELTAQQVKQVLMESVVKYPQQKVILPKENPAQEAKQVFFHTLSVSDGLINVYQALQAAEQLSTQ